MPFVSTRTVRFGECDPARIVYFSRYFEYAHEAYEDMLEAGGFPLQEVFPRQLGHAVGSRRVRTTPGRRGWGTG